MILKSVFTVLMLFVFAFSSHAEEAQPLFLQLKEIIEEALAKNPEIVAAKNQWRAAREKIPQASSLDDPVLSYTYQLRSVETRVGPQRNMVGVSQRFPFFGKLSLRKEMASQGAQRARELHEAKKLEVVAKTKSAYYSLFMVHKAIQINQENVEILRRFSRIAEIKYATGKVSQQDVLKAQVELASLANELITLKQEKETAEAAFNVLLDRAPQLPVGVPREAKRRPLADTLESLQQMATERQPLLKALQSAIDKSKAALALKHRMYFPDFTLGVNYIEVKGGTTLSGDDGKDSLLFTARINIPLWTGKIRAGVQEAQADINRNKARYRAMRNKILFDVKDSFVKVRTAGRLVDLFKTTILPLAEQSLEAATIGYQADKVDFLNVLESQRVIQNFQLEYYRALVSYEQQLAELERTVGFDLVSR